MVMILLIFVWTAILTVGLVEVGNYLWNRRRVARLVAESDRMANDDLVTGYTELVKEPFQVLVTPRVPRCEPQGGENSII